MQIKRYHKQGSESLLAMMTIFTIWSRGPKPFQRITALQEASLLLSFSSPFLLRPVSPPACLLSPIVKQLVSLQQESRLTFLPNLNRFTLELKKSFFLENHHTVLKAMYAV